MEDVAKFCIDYLEKKDCEYVEVRVEEKDINGFVFKNGVVELSGFDSIKGIGVRFLLNKTLGFVSLNDFGRDKIKENLNRALKVTSKAKNFSDSTGLSDEESVKKSYKVKQKIKFENVGVEEKLKVLKDIHDDIKSENLAGSFLNLSDEVAKKYYVNNNGTRIVSEIPRSNFFYLLTIRKADKSVQRMNMFGATEGWESVKKWKLNEKLLSEFKALNNNIEKGVRVPKEELDLVVAPEVVGIMAHESCGHPTEADRIFGRESAQAGESFITKKMIGDKIGSKEVSIVDDPTLDGTNGHFLYDDEGVKARRNYLYKDGKIAGFLHNRETANAMGIKSNGCARAGDYDKEVLVRMSNTFLLPGKMKEEELIKGIKKGVYIKNFMEWNINDRRWNAKYTGGESYLIESGEITKPVRNPSIEITTPKLWQSVDGIGNNFELIAAPCGKGEPCQVAPVTCGGPSMRLRKVRLS